MAWLVTAISLFLFSFLGSLCGIPQNDGTKFRFWDGMGMGWDGWPPIKELLCSALPHLNAKWNVKYIDRRRCQNIVEILD